MAEDLIIKKVITKGDMKKFIKLPWKIYKNDPYWVPPLLMDIKAKFDPRKNPFHEHAETQFFLALRGKEIIGRICAIVNFRHNEEHDEKVVFFGFFECQNDQEAAVALVEAVKKWGKEKNMDQIRGPANFSSSDDWGLQIKGFDSSPMIMMPYNPEYYVGLMEGTGLKKIKDLLAYHLDLQAEIPERIQRMQEVIRKRFQVTTRTLDMKNFDKEVSLFQEIYNKAWTYNWGFISMTEAEIKHMAKELKPVVVPEMVQFAYVKGEPAGIVLSLPDYNQAIKYVKNGRLFPFGLFTLLSRSKKITAGRMIGLGIAREYQKKGLEALFIMDSWSAGKKRGYLDGELSWLLEDNTDVINVVERVGGKPYKKYRIYNGQL